MRDVVPDYNNSSFYLTLSMSCKVFPVACPASICPFCEKNIEDEVHGKCPVMTRSGSSVHFASVEDAGRWRARSNRRTQGGQTRKELENGGEGLGMGQGLKNMGQKAHPGGKLERN